MFWKVGVGGGSLGSGGGTGLQETFAASGLPVMLLRRNVDEAAWKREQVSELKREGGK